MLWLQSMAVPIPCPAPKMAKILGTDKNLGAATHGIKTVMKDFIGLATIMMLNSGVSIATDGILTQLRLEVKVLILKM